MLLFTITVLQVYYVPSEEQQSIEKLKKQGQDALVTLDESGRLRPWVYDEDWPSLIDALRELLSNDIDFQILVDDDPDFSSPLNTGPLESGSPPPSDSSVATVTYAISGYQTDNDPRFIALNLWYII